VRSVLYVFDPSKPGTLLNTFAGVSTAPIVRVVLRVGSLCFYCLVAMGLDVKFKGVILGACFLIVSILETKLALCVTYFSDFSVTELYTFKSECRPLLPGLTLTVKTSGTHLFRCNRFHLKTEIFGYYLGYQRFLSHAFAQLPAEGRHDRLINTRRKENMRHESSRVFERARKASCTQGI